MWDYVSNAADPIQFLVLGHGRSGVDAAVDELVEHRRYFVERLYVIASSRAGRCCPTTDWSGWAARCSSRSPAARPSRRCSRTNPTWRPACTRRSRSTTGSSAGAPHLPERRIRMAGETRPFVDMGRPTEERSPRSRFSSAGRSCGSSATERSPFPTSSAWQIRCGLFDRATTPEQRSRLRETRQVSTKRPRRRERPTRRPTRFGASFALYG